MIWRSCMIVQRTSTYAANWSTVKETLNFRNINEMSSSPYIWRQTRFELFHSLFPFIQFFVWIAPNPHGLQYLSLCRIISGSVVDPHLELLFYTSMWNHKMFLQCRTVRFSPVIFEMLLSCENPFILVFPIKWGSAFCFWVLRVFP